MVIFDDKIGDTCHQNMEMITYVLKGRLHNKGNQKLMHLFEPDNILYLI